MRSSIKTVFVISFAGTVGITLLLGLFTVSTANRLQSLNSFIGQEVLSGVGAAGRMLGAVEELRIFHAELLHANGKEGVAAETREIIARETTVAALLKDVSNKADSDVERQIAAEAAPLANAYLRDSRTLRTLMLRGNTAEAERLYMGSLDSGFDRLNALLTRFLAYNDRQARKAVNDGSITNRQAQWFIWSSVLLALAGTAAIFLMKLQQVIRPLLRITQSIRRLAEGEMDTPVPEMQAANEFGDLA